MLPLNSAEFASSRPEAVAKDQLFFYKFFKEKGERDRRAGKHKRKGDDDDEDDDDDDDDEDDEVSICAGCEQARLPVWRV